MSDRNENFNSSKCGYTEAQIRARAASTNHPFWSVHCLNGEAHKHDDRHASAYYSVETGWYGCRVCGLKGFADDRDRPDWNKPQDRTYSNGTVVHRRVQDGKKKVIQTVSKSKKKAQPYNHSTLHPGIQRIWIVEGEKCADTLQPHLDPRTQAVVTSLQGSSSPHLTDWTAVQDARERGCEILFLPDLDKAGAKYIFGVAKQLYIDKLNVIRLDPKRNDGYDIVDWLDEGHTIANLPKPEIVTAKPAEASVVDRSQIVRSTAYEREVGQLSIDNRIDSNKSKPAETVEWLIHPFVAAGHATVLYGAPASGKSTVARALVKAMIESIDPFDDSKPQLFDGTPGRILWWMGEEHLATTLLKFDTIGIDREWCDILDRDFDWQCTDEIVIEPDGSDHFAVKSPYTQLLERIDAANAAGKPYRAIIIDSLPQIIGDTNKAEIFERRWKEIIVPLERRNVAVIAIAHPRKDNPTNASLEASLKGTERLFSLPRLVVYARAAPTKDLLAQSKEREEGVIHSNPIRDRFNATGDSDLREDEGLIGVLVPLKNSHERPENLTAYQYSIVNLDGIGIARFSYKPWRTNDFTTQQLDGRSFGATVAEKYELKRRERLSKSEQLAQEHLADHESTQISLNRMYEQAAKNNPEGIASDALQKFIEDMGFEWRTGQSARTRLKHFTYDFRKKRYIPKGI